MTTTAVLDWDAIARTDMAGAPFAWGLVRDSVPQIATRRALAAQFPTEGFTLTERAAGTAAGKGYRTWNLSLVQDGLVNEETVRGLTPLWRGLVDSLLGDAYRTAVAAATGQDLDACTLEVRAVRYGAGSWIDPHTDRADKIVTQTWYFNEGWREAWSGALRILRSPSADDVAAEVLPGLTDSVLLVPSPHSWHTVMPVAAEAEQQRHVLLVHFVSKDRTTW
ncbi:2OG-Fe(II) oxygenase superfamily protein [Sinosporangium album]|uniref:2OG-Fe(II) oxygenase superfamily protein n=1 Tax=Sinosporangium album TaxID=504805 RepID=A0A1G7QKM2_9ACTN|nr:2OG-Fe(II) oxygenase [Sinosporangium album]SDF99101.1 2OG-Fe(II) oxygenase superfamily protein [Sinosporangium album]